MPISQDQKEYLFKAFAFFIKEFRLYIISILKKEAGDRWEIWFEESLNPTQRNSWNINRQGTSAEDLIDFQHLKPFYFRYKDLMKDDFARDISKLGTWLESIYEIRNKLAHFQEITEDEYHSSFILMKNISRRIKSQGLVNEIEKIQQLQSFPSKKEGIPGRFSKMVILALTIIAIIPVYYLFKNLNQPKTIECDTKANNLGIILTNFSLSEEDAFSHKVYNILDSELSQNDSLSIIRHREHLSAGIKDRKDSLLKIFDVNCITHGLLVSGKWDPGSNLFDCKIFVNNVIRLNQSIISKQNNNIIYIRNPDLLTFSLENQSQVLADFIIALLLYNTNKLPEARENFFSAMPSNNNEHNSKFLSLCNSFIGNTYLIDNNLDLAYAFYKKAIELNPKDAYLRFNLASTYLLQKDSVNAFKFYQTAFTEDVEFGNPLSGIFDPDLKKEKKSNPQKLVNQAREENNISKVKPVVLNISRTQSLYTILSMNGKFGVINNSSDTIIKCQYDNIFDHSVVGKKRYFIVQLGSQFGAINEKGQVEIAIKQKSKDAVLSIIELEEQKNDTESISF